MLWCPGGFVGGVGRMVTSLFSGPDYLLVRQFKRSNAGEVYLTVEMSKSVEGILFLLLHK